MSTAMQILILSWMWFIASAKVLEPVELYMEQKFTSPAPVKLSMMDQSVDDMYSGCINVMTAKVQNKYFPKEMKNSDFKKAWKNSDSCFKKAQSKLKPTDKDLTENHLRAICVYTAADTYKDFNEKGKSSAKGYTTGSFKYYSLHFWLTRAIQILATNNQTCHSTIRRSRETFTGEIKQIVRFGHFASSSFDQKLFNYGKKTCFLIRTCLGAFLRHFSFFEYEEEVLIPPYEMFKITKITEKPKKDLECEKIIELKSVGIHSGLNCKAAFKEGFKTV